MYKGIIIRNGLESNSSWGKRVAHWRESFHYYNIENQIFSAYPVSSQFYNKSKLIHKILSNYYFRYFLSPFIIFFKLYKIKPDFVLLANGGFWEFFSIPFYCRFTKTPLLIDIVDTIGRKYKLKKSLIDYLIIINKILFDYFVVKNANEIFVISSLLEKEYQSRFPQKIVTRSIPSTVDIFNFEINTQIALEELRSDKYFIFNKDEFIKIFYAGSLTRLNGVEFFFSCISEILKSNDLKIKLIFAIIGGNVDALFKLSVKYSVNHLLVVVPPVTQYHLPVLLEKADILFIPEQGIETANAGFPGKTSEYLMSGTPIITTAFSDLDHYLFDGINACVSNLGDKHVYKKNLIKLLNDKQFRAIIGKKGRETAIANFSHLDCSVPYILSIKRCYRYLSKST